MKKFYLISLLFLLTTSQAFAAQTINITQDPTDNVYGNSTALTGFGNPTRDPNGNTVNLNTPSLNFGSFNVYGASITNPSATTVSNNTVNVIASGLDIAEIYGAYCDTCNRSMTVNNNSVMINETSNGSFGVVVGALYSGISGIVKDNKVDIRSGKINIVYGGEALLSSSSDSVVDSNHVYLSNITSAGVSGSSSIAGGIGNNVFTITNNAVEINNSTLSDFSISGGSYIEDTSVVVGNYEISGNTVSISGGSYNNNNIYGGSYASNNSLGALSVSNNTVNISDGTFIGGTIVGGYANGYSAVNNSINISGNAVFKNATLYGGFGTTVSNNTINIESGEIEGNVYGGYAGSATNAVVKDNVINISGNPNLTQATLFGGIAENGSVSGNTLNLQTRISVLSASNFQQYNFYLDGTNLDNPILKGTQTAIDMSDSVIGLYLKENASLKAGDVILLVENMRGTSIDQASGHLREGATMIYDWTLMPRGQNLYAVIDNDVSGGGNGNGGGRLNPEVKSLLESRISSISILSLGADVVADNGFSAVDSALAKDDSGLFSSINVSSIKSNTGSQTDNNTSSKMKAGQSKNSSYVDTQSGSLIVGVGSKAEGLLLGAFLEAGVGKHDTYNEFAESTVKGSGNNTYTGAGLLGRLDFDFMYVDTSVRGGYVSTDFKADYSPDAKYNIGSLYYGGHAGVGLVQNMNSFSLNEYVKYLATMQQGNKVVLDSGETINFDSVMSSRAVAGIRAKYESIFVGYAYEQELNGEAGATTSKPQANTAINAPVIKGGTSVIEAGYDQTFIQKATRSQDRFSFNVGLGGKYYIGVRNGFSINAKIGYIF
ncbi:MAG: hypothetical protein LBQ34_02045 [Alphaproteobacteria bacterium]|jgi:hypothetical protein|nr:hypothetical protein [Alphaproteobacteria bacterium]